MSHKKDRNEHPKQSAVSGVFADSRPQPNNPEAERAVLSAMLREPAACVDIAIENLSTSSVFYYHVHREIFKSLVRVHEATHGSADMLAVADDLRKAGKLDEIGGELVLAELHGAISTTANLENWCAIVAENAMLRRMIDVCQESLLHCADSSKNAKDIIDEIEAKIFEVRFSVEKSDIVQIKDSVHSTFEYLQKVLRHEVDIGIKTGYPDLDRMVFGFKPGEMFVLAARPSIGKTSIALNMLRNIALRTDHPAVAFFSLEMTADQITRRLICAEADVSESSFYNNKFRSTDLPKLTKAVKTYEQANIFIDPTSGISISELRAKARRLCAEHDIKLIAIDYLQLMTGDDRSRKESRQQEVASISGGLKSLAKDLNVPVLVLAQLNREIEKSTSGDARPKLSHLRESGSIEQDADVVTFLHRSRDQAKGLSDEQSRAGVDAELIVEKNRNGQTGMVPLKFFPHRMEFVNVSRFEEEPTSTGGRFG
ncbi:MAG: replicative DNA helicase [Victivallaceae bacterium]|nr:replicative DNA helicase [Victivallaceae bacterium]MDD4180409.1 replicative DNA helicase [Victivallaceae bacterium]